MESLMLSAVMAGAGGVSRHHFGHGAGMSFASYCVRLSLGDGSGTVPGNERI